MVVAEVSGAFTASGVGQTAVLIARAPVPGRDAKPSMLAVFETDRVVAQFVSPDVVYSSIASAVDVNEDGIDELILTAQSYQMGQVRMIADVVTLAGGQQRLVQEVGAVYENTCDAPLGEKLVRTMLLFARTDGALMTMPLAADCSKDGAAPELDTFAVIGGMTALGGGASKP
jgi:hypothetical protein